MNTQQNPQLHKHSVRHSTFYMTAKDKANELVEKFYQNAPETTGTARAMEFGVKMALIVVDEIIKSEPTHPYDGSYWELLSDLTSDCISYWNDVKDELLAQS